MDKLSSAGGPPLRPIEGAELFFVMTYPLGQCFEREAEIRNLSSEAEQRVRLPTPGPVLLDECEASGCGLPGRRGSRSRVGGVPAEARPAASRRSPVSLAVKSDSRVGSCICCELLRSSQNQGKARYPDNPQNPQASYYYELLTG